MSELYMIDDPAFRKDVYMMESAIIDANRIALVLETQCQLSEIHLREAESRYYSESAGQPDFMKLVAFYEEAQEKTDETKKNLFQKLMDAIRNVWEKIVKVVTGKDPKGNDNDQVEVDSALWGVAKKVNEIWAEVKQMCLHPIKYWSEGGKLDKLKELLTFSGGAAVIKVSFKSAMEIRKNLKDTVGEIDKSGVLDTFKSGIEDWLNKHDYGKDPKECSGLLNKFVATIGKCISHITAACQNVKNAVTGKDGTEQTEGEKSDNTSEEKPKEKKEGFFSKVTQKVGDVFNKNTDNKNTDSDEGSTTKNDESTNEGNSDNGDSSDENKNPSDEKKKDEKKDEEAKTESAEDFLSDIIESFYNEGGDDSNDDYLDTPDTEYDEDFMEGGDDDSFVDDFNDFFNEDASNLLDDLDYEREMTSRSISNSIDEFDDFLKGIL